MHTDAAILILKTFGEVPRNGTFVLLSRTADTFVPNLPFHICLQMVRATAEMCFKMVLAAVFVTQQKSDIERPKGPASVEL